MTTFCIECDPDVFKLLLNDSNLGIKLKNDDKSNDSSDVEVFNIENKDNDSYTDVELCNICDTTPCLSNFVDVDKIIKSLSESNEKLFFKYNTNKEYESICSNFFKSCPTCLIKSYNINIINGYIPRCMVNCHCLNFNGINDYMYFFKYIFTYAKNNFLKDDKNKYKCNSCNAICVGITSFFNHTFNKCRKRDDENLDRINKIKKKTDFKFKFPQVQCDKCRLTYDVGYKNYHNKYECLIKCDTCLGEYKGNDQYRNHINNYCLRKCRKCKKSFRGNKNIRIHQNKECPNI